MADDQETIEGFSLEELETDAEDASKGREPSKQVPIKPEEE